MNCKAKNSDDNIGIWQWVVGASDSVYDYEVLTNHYMCKSGVGFDKPPRCPLGACADNPCNVCNNW